MLAQFAWNCTVFAPVGLKLSLIFFLCLLIPAKAVEASDGLYIIYGPRGSITFSSQPPKNGRRYERFKSSRRGFSTFRGIQSWNPRPIKSEFGPAIKRFAKKHSVEAALVFAIVHVESAFKPNARSPKGAVGLMQLMPTTARRFGVNNRNDPEQNLEGGIKYLKGLLLRYRGNLSFALAAYNAGEGAVDRYGGIPKYAETQNYVRRVLRAREIYRCLGSGTHCMR